MAAGRRNLEQADDASGQSRQRWKTVGKIAGGIALAGLTAYGSHKLFQDRDKSRESPLFRKHKSAHDLTMEEM